MCLRWHGVTSGSNQQSNLWQVQFPRPFLGDGFRNCLFHFVSTFLVVIEPTDFFKWAEATNQFSNMSRQLRWFDNVAQRTSRRANFLWARGSIWPLVRSGASLGMDGIWVCEWEHFLLGPCLLHFPCAYAPDVFRMFLTNRLPNRRSWTERSKEQKQGTLGLRDADTIHLMHIRSHRHICTFQPQLW